MIKFRLMLKAAPGYHALADFRLKAQECLGWVSHIHNVFPISLRVGSRNSKIGTGKPCFMAVLVNILLFQINALEPWL